jgi:hypothetical protein
MFWELTVPDQICYTNVMLKPGLVRVGVRSLERWAPSSERTAPLTTPGFSMTV